MSDYRSPDDPLRRDVRYDDDARSANATWGWIAGAVFVVVVLAVAFGIGHSKPNMNTASNQTTPPAVNQITPPTRLAPPANSPANPAFTPGPKTTTQPQQ